MKRDYQIGLLWMRGNLSFLEQLCVKSFVDAGHDTVLYSYDEIGHVPDGVERRSASDILPESGFLTHERTGSPALHSDLFRYRLLEGADRMIWADTDAYCMRPFETPTGHFHGWESEKHINGGVLGLPRDSATLAALLDLTTDEFAIPVWYKDDYVAELRAARDAGKPVHVGEQPWGVWGPHAITHFLHETGEVRYSLPREALYPFSFRDRRKMLKPDTDLTKYITAQTASVHLYGRRMRKRLAEVDEGLPHPESLLGQLLLKHRIDPVEAPLRDFPHPDRDHPFARVYRENITGVTHPVTAPPPQAEPQPAPAPVHAEARPLGRVLAITTMKNEGPFIVDWVAHHLSIGVNHFLVYTNDCDDQTEAILDGLALRGLVTRVDNPFDREKQERPQRAALADAETQQAYVDADAYVVMDVDEYINVHVGDGTLTDLFAAAGDPDLLSMTWRFFGCGGVTGFEDAPVTEQFFECAPQMTRFPHHNWGFKTIVRKPSPFSKIGVHRPLRPIAPQMPRWVNGSGQQMPEGYLTQGWRSNIDCWGYGLVTLNHYAIRSIDSFLVKRDRGRTNHINRDQGITYWNVFNRNDERDESILPHARRAAPLRDALLADPEIGPLHEAACAWHRGRIAELKELPDFAELHAALRADPRSHALPDDTGGDEGGTRMPLKPERATAPAAKPDDTVAGDGSPRRFTPNGDPILLGPEAEDAYRSLQERRLKSAGHLTVVKEFPSTERVTVVTSMRNEAPFILEWIAYHKSIGVTDFLVYTNDCTDPTNAILNRLAELGHVTRLDNPFKKEKGQKPQRGALNDAAGQPLVKDADWTAVIDVDEFIDIHVGDGTIPALVQAMNGPNVISPTWRFFGNGGVVEYEDGWITEQFTRAAPRFLPKPRLGWGFKTLAHRSAPFGKLGVHRPLNLDEDRVGDVRWVNGSGVEMPEELITGNGWRSTKRTVGYDMVTLNHYILRSAESYLVKRERGRINHVDQDQGQYYWHRRNYASEREENILRNLPRAHAVHAGLMADPALAALHAEAVAWHKARIATLKADPDYATLFAAITDPAGEDALYMAEKDNTDGAAPAASGTGG